MAHERPRHIKEAFQAMLAFSPLVGIFGHRQVGKSTFLGASVSEYRTFDDIETLDVALKSPKSFLQSATKFPVAIDECQLAPPLFPSLKEWVRTNKRPGQFVLSGSVRFTSRKVIRESLAGRLALLEMLPFSVTEALGMPLSDIVPRLLQHKRFSQDSITCLHSVKRQHAVKKAFDVYLENGGLPGLCFIRSRQLQRTALNDLHELILARDLGLVSDVRTSVATLKKFLSFIAARAFEPYVATDVRKAFGLAPQTQKKILDGLEAIFLIRRLPIPQRKKDVILLEDQLEEFVYGGAALTLNRRLETAVYRNIRTQFLYGADKTAQFQSYLTRDHARVPIVVVGDQQTLGLIVFEGKRPSISEMRSGASFLKSHGDAKMLYVSNDSVASHVLDDRNLLCPITAIL